MQSLTAIPNKMWLLLAAGPALFLLGIVAASIFLAVRGVPAAQIPARAATLMPYILLGVLVAIAIFMVRFVPEIKAAWLLPDSGKALTDITVGLFAGTLLAFAYIYWLAPLLETVQRTFGDYVPPGAVLPTISGAIGVFFIANILLAPLVEETLYRGIAIPLLATHLGMMWAVVLSCLFFALLHWAGGFWYMLLTGVVAGGLFAALYSWRGGVLAPFAAHLMLNLIEFIYAWHKQNPS